MRFSEPDSHSSLLHARKIQPIPLQKQPVCWRLALILFGVPVHFAFAEIEPAAAAGTDVSFNGTDLTGFRTWLVDSKHEDPRQVFTVTNGLLRISGEGLGYLGTEEEHDNYHLLAEFKWGRTNWRWGDRLGKARDSGIFLHATGPDGNSADGHGAFMAAIECNIFQGATGDLLLIRGTNSNGSLLAPRITAEIGRHRDSDGWPFWKKGGPRETIVRWGRLNWSGKDRGWKDEIDFRGRHDVEKPYGEWNRIECICAEGHIQILLNGTLVNEAFAATPRRGRVLLQCEGSEISFRKLELRPLKRKGL